MEFQEFQIRNVTKANWKEAEKKQKKQVSTKHNIQVHNSYCYGNCLGLTQLDSGKFFDLRNVVGVITEDNTDGYAWLNVQH